MSNNNNFEIKIEVDDSDVKRSFQNTSKGLKQLEDDADEVEKAFNDAFDPKEINKANKAIIKTNKEIDQTSKELKSIDNQGKKANRSLQAGFRKTGRSISRVRGGLNGLFARSGIGIFLIAIAGIISGFASFKDKALDSLGAVGDFIRGLIEGARDLASFLTFGLIDSTKTVIAELKKQRAEIVNSATLVGTEIAKIEAETAITKAKIRGASAKELLELEKENNRAIFDANSTALFQIQKQIEEGILKTISLRKKSASATTELQKQEILKELELNFKKIKELQKQEAEGTLFQAQKELEIIEKKKAAEAKAKADAKGIRDKVTAQEEKDAKEAADREAKRLAEDLKLRLLFLVDEQTAKEIQLQNEAEANKELARKNIQDATTLNAILIAIENKKIEDIQELRKNAIDKEKEQQNKALQDKFAEQQAILENELRFEEATLRKKQILQRQEFEATEQTENEIAVFERQQQIEREEQALRFERRRLELILEFGGLRTEAEISTTKALIAAIDAEIAGLENKAEGGEGGEGGGFLQKLLGLDDEQLKALQEATEFAINEVNKLLDSKLNALDTELDRRETNLDRLNTLLAAETALLQAGEAANVQGTKNQIEQEEKAREEALKKQRAALIAKQSIDAITQTSSLITASAQIFQSLAGLPFGIGIPIAVGVIATMFGAFAAAQATAFSSIAPVSLYTGGRITQGEKDTNGGAGLKIEGTNARVGRGEWIVNANTSEKQNAFISELNTGKFDNVDFFSMLGDGSMKKISVVEKSTKRAFNKKSNSNIAKMYAREIKKQTSVLSRGLNDLYSKPQLVPTKTGFIERSTDKRGNTTTKKINLSQ